MIKMIRAVRRFTLVLMNKNSKQRKTELTLIKTPTRLLQLSQIKEVELWLILMMKKCSLVILGQKDSQLLKLHLK